MNKLDEGFTQLSSQMSAVSNQVQALDERVGREFRDVKIALQQLTAMTQYNTVVVEMIYHALWVDPFQKIHAVSYSYQFN